MATFSVDWDDTMAPNEYPNAGTLNPKAVRAMRMMHAYGHEIVVNSCRTGEEQAAIEYCIYENSLPVSHVNENCPCRIMHYGGKDTRKIGADYYIDDRNIGKWTWEDVYDIIRHAPQTPDLQCCHSAYDYANHYGCYEKNWYEQIIMGESC